MLPKNRCEIFQGFFCNPVPCFADLHTPRVLPALQPRGPLCVARGHAGFLNLNVGASFVNLRARVMLELSKNPQFLKFTVLRLFELEMSENLRFELAQKPLSVWSFRICSSLELSFRICGPFEISVVLGLWFGDFPADQVRGKRTS